MTLSRVAYVEDEHDIRELATIAMDAIGGFEVRDFSNGPDALEALPAFHPDLIVLDVMMPEMDGRELFRRLSQKPSLRNVPVIFMTAKSMPNEMAELREMGAVGVIPKPFDPMALPDELHAIWSRR